VFRQDVSPHAPGLAEGVSLQPRRFREQIREQAMLWPSDEHFVDVS
jgi:hypothetical protein